MINHIYRLVSPRQFVVTFKNEHLNDDNIVVRPLYLSICAADQRYYTGTRGKEALSKKLPMALIHEAIGQVVYDPKGAFKNGEYVVMVPNIPTEEDSIIAENYLRSSRFRSSGYDGFMQDYVFLNRDRLVSLGENLNLEVAAFLELITISVHSIKRFNERAHQRKNIIGVWGDGNLGFITALILKHKYPESKIVVFGKTEYKLQHFSFADEVYQIDKLPEDLSIDHGFECVGGRGSQYAINQMIDIINPEGTMSILGVSEDLVEVNTRMVLEKGLTIIGSSRSGRVDFEEAVALLKSTPKLQSYLETLIGEVHEVKTIQDILSAFESDLTSSWGKTIMKWEI